jgi:N-acetylglucosamine kinase-like BadF-type ATPase
VFKVADEGDEVARHIVEWTGGRLADLVCGVIHQLELENETFDVVKVGSLWKSGSLMGEAMRLKVQQVAPGANPVSLLASPAIGGIILGMQQIGAIQPGFRRRLIDSYLSKITGNQNN